MPSQVYFQQVYAIDQNPDRLVTAEAFGAHLIPEGQDPVTYLRNVTEQRGVDSMMEAVGSPAALRCAFDAVRMGGEPLSRSGGFCGLPALSLLVFS